MPTEPPATPTRPAERYGDRRPVWHSTLARVLTVVLGLLLVAFTVLAGWQAADRDVRWKDVGFHVRDATRTELTFDVTVYRGSTATCTVHALTGNYAEVGTLQVPVEAGDAGSVRMRVEILTLSEAVSAEVVGCTVP